MTRLLAIITALFLAWALPAAATMSVNDDGQAGNGSAAIAGPLLLTTTANASASAHDVVAVVVTYASNNTVGRTMIDDAGNTYVEAPASCTFNTANRQVLFYAQVTSDLASGHTITLNWTGSAKVAAAAAIVHGADVTNPLFSQGACQTNASSASASIASGAAPFNGLVLGFTGSNASLSGYASNSPFTDLTGTTGTGLASVEWGYDVAASATYAPSWSVARPNAVNTATFVAPAVTSSRMILARGVPGSAILQNVNVRFGNLTPAGRGGVAMNSNTARNSGGLGFPFSGLDIIAVEGGALTGWLVHQTSQPGACGALPTIPAGCAFKIGTIPITASDNVTPFAVDASTPVPNASAGVTGADGDQYVFTLTPVGALTSPPSATLTYTVVANAVNIGDQAADTWANAMFPTGFGTTPGAKILLSTGAWRQASNSLKGLNTAFNACSTNVSYWPKDEAHRVTFEPANLDRPAGISYVDIQGCQFMTVNQIMTTYDQRLAKPGTNDFTLSQTDHITLQDDGGFRTANTMNPPDAKVSNYVSLRTVGAVSTIVNNYRTMFTNGTYADGATSNGLTNAQKPATSIVFNGLRATYGDDNYATVQDGNYEFNDLVFLAPHAYTGAHPDTIQVLNGYAPTLIINRAFIAELDGNGIFPAAPFTGHQTGVKGYITDNGDGTGVLHIVGSSTGTQPPRPAMQQPPIASGSTPIQGNTTTGAGVLQTMNADGTPGPAIPANTIVIASLGCGGSPPSTTCNQGQSNIQPSMSWTVKFGGPGMNVGSPASPTAFIGAAPTICVNNEFFISPDHASVSNSIGNAGSLCHGAVSGNDYAAGFQNFTFLRQQRRAPTVADISSASTAITSGVNGTLTYPDGSTILTTNTTLSRDYGIFDNQWLFAPPALADPATYPFAQGDSLARVKTGSFKPIHGTAPFAVQLNGQGVPIPGQTPNSVPLNVASGQVVVKPAGTHMWSIDSLPLTSDGPGINFQNDDAQPLWQTVGSAFHYGNGFTWDPKIQFGSLTTFPGTEGPLSASCVANGCIVNPDGSAWDGPPGTGCPGCTNTAKIYSVTTLPSKYPISASDPATVTAWPAGGPPFNTGCTAGTGGIYACDPEILAEDLTHTYATCSFTYESCTVPAFDAAINANMEFYASIAYPKVSSVLHPNANPAVGVSIGAFYDQLHWNDPGHTPIP